MNVYSVPPMCQALLWSSKRMDSVLTALTALVCDWATSICHVHATYDATVFLFFCILVLDVLSYLFWDLVKVIPFLQNFSYSPVRYLVPRAACCLHFEYSFHPLRILLWCWGCRSVVEHFSSVCGVVCLILNTTKTKQNKTTCKQSIVLQQQILTVWPTRMGVLLGYSILLVFFWYIYSIQ